MKSNKKPLVSIVVPIYKVPEKYLRNNIEHLINQTLKEIEILLIDDGSPDDCGNICEEYKKIDDRIKVIHQENLGLCGARNTGVKNANGDYIMFVDGDDFINNDACEILYLNSNKGKYDVVNGCMTKDYDSNIIEYDYSYFEDGRIYTNDECRFWQEKILDFRANISSVNAKIIKRSLMLNNNIFHNEQLKQGAEGIEFLIRLFDIVDSVKFVKKNIYHYIHNDKSITQKHDEKNHYYVLLCFEEIEKTIKKSKNVDALYKSLYTRLIYVIITTAISGYFSPTNKESYRMQKRKFKMFMDHKLLRNSMKNANISLLDKKRRIVYYFIKNKMYLMIKLLAFIRYSQKKNS